MALEAIDDKTVDKKDSLIRLLRPLEGSPYAIPLPGYWFSRAMKSFITTPLLWLSSILAFHALSAMAFAKAPTAAAVGLGALCAGSHFYIATPP